MSKELTADQLFALEKVRRALPHMTREQLEAELLQAFETSLSSQNAAKAIIKHYLDRGV